MVKNKLTGGSYKFKEPSNQVKNEFEWSNKKVLIIINLKHLYLTLFEDFWRNIPFIKPSKLNYNKYVIRDLDQKLIFKKQSNKSYLIGNGIVPINNFFYFLKGITKSYYFFVLKKKNLIQRIIFKFNNFSVLKYEIELIDNLNK